MIEIEENEEIELVNMHSMKPLQIGVIVNKGDDYDGTIVMRTASAINFEVMNLSNPGKDKCWTTDCYLPVRLLSKNESVTLKVTN